MTLNRNDEEETEVLIQHKMLFLLINLMPFIFIAVFPLFSLPLPVYLYAVGVMVFITFWRRITNIVLLLSNHYSAYKGKIISLRKERRWHWHWRASYSEIHYIALFELENGKTVPLCVDRVTFFSLKEQQNAHLVWFKYPKDKTYGAIMF